MSSVEISGLRKSYGNVVALSDINVSIISGQFYTLLGPSGCGKTTLLRTIAGFHYQDLGTITVNGTAIESMAAHKRDVAMVFQDYAVFPHLSVFDNVAFGLKQRKVTSSELDTRVNEALRVVQMEHLSSRMPHELSGGQQQRVGLARAIVVRSKVLLMDEPLSNLDAKLRVELRAELRKIQQDLGMTTIYVTHDQEEALAMSDVVCVMYNGIIQQAASPYEIYAEPANKFVASFVGGNNFLAIENIDGEARLKSALIKIANIDTKSQIVAAVRPESFSVHDQNNDAKKNIVLIDVSINQISFIGREIELYASTSENETIKCITRPNKQVLDLKVGDKAVFAFDKSDALLFEDSDTGARVK